MSNKGQGRVKKFLKKAEEKDKWTCWICKKDETDFELATVDHVFPISRGGSDFAHNFKLSHKECNIKKSDKLPLTGGVFIVEIKELEKFLSISIDTVRKLDEEEYEKLIKRLSEIKEYWIKRYKINGS